MKSLRLIGTLAGLALLTACLAQTTNQETTPNMEAAPAAPAPPTAAVANPPAKQHPPIKLTRADKAPRYKADGAKFVAAARGAGKPIRLIAEAEDFEVVKGDWQVVPYRENYYASTFALTFLSRMGCLGAPAQIEKGQEAVAEQEVYIPAAGAYELLARYEQPYDFTAEFDVELVQKGKVVARKPMGRYTDVKIWGCSGSPEARRVPMTRFFWGATDNIVWQNAGNVNLAAGNATIRLIAGPQLEGGKPRGQVAKRNIDLICLTNDKAGREAQKKHRNSRTYLEMDGWLVQDGDLYVRFTNPKGAPGPVAPQVVPNNGGQHSPYYIHLRDWPNTTVLKTGRLVDKTSYFLTGPRSRSVDPRHVAPIIDPAQYTVVDKAKRKKTVIPPEAMLQPGDRSGWIPLGGVVDALNDYIWMMKTKNPLELEFAVPDGKGGLQSVRKLTITGSTGFEISGCAAPNPWLRKILAQRYWLPEVRTQTEALNWLIAEVKKFKKNGSTPKRFLIYKIMGWGGLQFPEGQQLALALGDNTAVVTGKKRGIITHRRNPDVSAIKQEEAGKTPLDDIYIVSYGDEMHLPAYGLKDEEFGKWLKDNKIKYKGPIAFTKDKADPLYYYSKIAAKERGAKRFAAGTAYYKSKGVLTGTNYSPHSNYLVTELDYIRPFKLKALTMPWSEDYVWQIPEFSIQAMGYLTSAFRAGAKYDDLPIHMYVMPHSPGNTPRDFRLSYYTAIAHGAKQINYFCASPLAVGGTENYVATNDLEMWRAIHDCTYAAGIFEDYVLDGGVRPAKVALLLSSVDDIMTGAVNSSFAMHNNERKAVFYALRHAQVPVDFISGDDVVEGLAKDYELIYVTQQWLHSNTVKALGKWVKAGGTLVSLYGGGFKNEFNQPNPDANKLYGVKKQALREDPKLLDYLLVPNKPFLSKQDLPRYKPFDRVTWEQAGQKVEDVGVMVWKQDLTAADGKVIGAYANGKPAVIEKQQGKGRTVLFGFLPGQAYLKSGLPLWPVDRGSHNEAYSHWLPTEMDANLRHAIVDAFLPEGYVRPVTASVQLVEAAVIDTAKPKARLAIPLMNYTGVPIADLQVSVPDLKRVRSVRSLERGKLKPTFADGVMTVTLPLDITDMLLIDK